MIALLLWVLLITPANATEIGIASVYSIKTNYGTHTASGERLNNNALTAAHKKLPMGTRVIVTNQKSGDSVVVRITDRGPYIHGRIIDLTPASARAINCNGLCKVSVKVLAKFELVSNDTNWVDKLASPGSGLCCTNNDGKRLEAVDWRRFEKGYQVYFENEGWVTVPKDREVEAHLNQDGIARVWSDKNNGVRWFRCFLPGAES